MCRVRVLGDAPRSINDLGFGFATSEIKPEPDEHSDERDDERAFPNGRSKGVVRRGHGQQIGV